MSQSAYIGEDFVLEPDTELRFEIEAKDSKVYVTLLSGYAEMFGTEFIIKRKYEFRTGAKVAVFTYHGCVLNVVGKTDVHYISKETPMIQYLNCHAALEQMRVHAQKCNERGPMAMIVGPTDVGKTTLCRILLNYAARLHRRPLYADLDVGQGSIAIPGTIATIVIDTPASIEEGFSRAPPLVFHCGHYTPSRNSELYKAIISTMAKVTLNSLDFKKESKYSGIIINTCGWIQGGGYSNMLHTVQAFKVNAIFVLDQERLYNELVRDVPSFVKVVLLPKSGGVVARSKELRYELRNLRLMEYFYGGRKRLCPYSFEVKFQALKIYKIGAPPLPDSCMPIGMKGEDNKTKLVAVTPSPALLHHILSVSFATKIEEDVISTNVKGFVCVTDVDMKRRVVIVLSPQPQPLPNNILLLSDLQFIDSHA